MITGAKNELICRTKFGTREEAGGAPGLFFSFPALGSP